MESISERGSIKGYQNKRYSIGFKRTVVQEIESGRMSIFGAQKRYGIGGATTIRQWIRKLGKTELLPTTVHIRMKEEVDELGAAQQRIKQLEKALSDMTLKHLASETLLKVASRHYGVDLKKSFGSEQSES